MDAALQLARAEGWAAVTTRRVAEAIDYSQPVIYQHFTGREGLLAEIARAGFDSLRTVTDEAATGGQSTGQPLAHLCRSYVTFGTRNPRLYEAMFTLPTALRFASADTPGELRDAFVSLRRAIAPHIGSADPDEAAELLWAACHGLVSLHTAERIPPDRIEAHIARIARMWK